MISVVQDTLLPSTAGDEHEAPSFCDERARLATLADTDWGFRDAVTNQATHGFHPYPARFIPQIPATLICAFTRPGEVVYDPFVGGGTTCVESNILGRNAMGGDVNELAILISRVKTTPLDNKLIDMALATSIRAKRYIDKAEVVDAAVPKQSIDWFHDFVIREIISIQNQIMELPNRKAQDFCQVALSAILISVSYQDSDTRYVRVRKKLLPGDAIARYARKLQTMANKMRVSRDTLLGGTTDVRVADSRQSGIFADDTADFVVTSPPYPNAYDYHLYHKHRLLWLGMDPLKLKRHEIGAHAHYSRKNGMDETDFQRDMEQVLMSVARILKRGKYFAVVVGDSILRGKHIRNAEIIKAAARRAGFHTVAEFKRKMNAKKKSFNPSHGNIVTEDIIILQNVR